MVCAGKGGCAAEIVSRSESGIERGSVYRHAYPMVKRGNGVYVMRRG